MTAVFGAATILLLPLLSAGIGRTAAATSAWLLALSPAMVFYSRMYIQESLFACFTLAFVIAVGRVATGGGPAWFALAGVAAGLAVATKETSVIVLPAALVACAIAWRSLGAGAAPESAGRRPRAAGGAREPGGRPQRSRGCSIRRFSPRRAASSSRFAAPAPTSIAASTRQPTRIRGTTTSACSRTRRPGA